MSRLPEGAELLARIEQELASFAAHDERNRIAPGQALRSDLAHMCLFDAPIVGVASAADPLFMRFCEPQAVGPQFRMPDEWLPGAASVVSYFFPISERVRESNRTGQWASDEWLHARIDGQAFILSAGRFLVGLLRDAGFDAMCPAASEEMRVVYLNGDDPADSFRSNWSERHVAHAGGLGTFSLSKGLITAHGMAGRLGSVVTAAELPPTQRAYDGLYDYCIRCGACIERCPVGAISFDKGKDHYRCYDMMMASKQLHPGYLGCGKCQVDVPCEFARP